MVEEGNRPECEQGCVRWSEAVSEQPAVEADRGQPQRDWLAGWGRQCRLQGETDLETDVTRVWLIQVLFNTYKSVMRENIYCVVLPTSYQQHRNY